MATVTFTLLDLTELKHYFKQGHHTHFNCVWRNINYSVMSMFLAGVANWKEPPVRRPPFLFKITFPGTKLTLLVGDDPTNLKGIPQLIYMNSRSQITPAERYDFFFFKRKECQACVGTESTY